MKFSNAKDIARHARDQREVIARELYDFEKVQAEIKRAATAGLNSCRIIQASYVDLQHTKEAKRLIEKLKQAGFECTWVEATQKEKVGQRESITMIAYKELMIAWGITERRMIGQVETA